MRETVTLTTTEVQRLTVLVELDGGQLTAAQAGPRQVEQLGQDAPESSSHSANFRNLVII